MILIVQSEMIEFRPGYSVESNSPEQSLKIGRVIALKYSARVIKRIDNKNDDQDGRCNSFD